MSGTIQKWGNSLALRIPAAMAKQIQVAAGDDVEFRVAEGGFFVRPARPRYRLADLVRRIKPPGRHAETGWGPAQGREVW